MGQCRTSSIKILVCFAFLPMLSTTANAAALWHPDDSHDTPVSGFVEERVVQKKLNFGLHQGIPWIDFGEKNNVPCYLGIHSRNLDGQSDKDAKGISWQECESPRAIRSAGFSDSPRFFLRGLAVCTSSVDKNFNRIKGLRVYAAKVWQTREQIDELDPTNERFVDEETRPNCGRWHMDVFCNPGYIAQGINVYSEGDAITGLGLHCTRVIFK